jgi:chaperonin GroEL (HSP60 family)
MAWQFRSEKQMNVWGFEMGAKQVLFHSEAREKVLRGAGKLADAVRVTLGPRSKCVLIQRQWAAPIVCNDDVTIAKEFDLKELEENLGARMLRQAAERTGELVGDGTSTATLLAYAIFADGLRNVVAGASAVDIKRGLDRGTATALASQRAMSSTVQTRKENAQVATISAHNDPATGDLVAEAMERVGNEGMITVEEILKRALEAPTHQIAESSAVDGVVVDRMLTSEGNIGFDAASKQYVDLSEAGIIDPTKVVRIALENAVSVAGALLLAEATMTERTL